MPNQKISTGAPRIIPTMRYIDAPAAIEWLVNALGAEKQLVVPGDDGTIAHAQLKLGDAFIMLGSTKDDVLQMRSPRELGGVTQSLYVYADDLDDRYERAKAAGAEILIALRDTEYGSREFSVRDPEGQLWHFGTYWPES